MRRCVVLLVLMMICAGQGWGEENTPAKKSAANNAEASATPRGQRLPNNYGKLGLTEEQKKKIYSIQANYKTRIQRLQQELEDLRNEEVLEIQSALTEAQKTSLQEILVEARKKREQRRK